MGLSDDEYQELVSQVDTDIEIVVGPNRELRNLIDGDRLDTQSSSVDQSTFRSLQGSRGAKLGRIFD